MQLHNDPEWLFPFEMMEVGDSFFIPTLKNAPLIYERNNTMKEEERKMLERRQGILKAAFLAKQSGDLELQGVIRKRIQKYNASTQGRLNPITGRTITTSVKQREKAIEDSVDGITLTKSYKDYLIEELGS